MQPACRVHLVSWVRIGFPPLSFLQTRISQQITDPLDRQVSRRIVRDVPGIERIVTLARKHRREPLPQDLLHRCKDAQLVIHHHVVRRRIAPLDIGQRLLLMDVHQYSALDRVPYSRALNLARLEDHVAIGQDHGRAPPS